MGTDLQELEELLLHLCRSLVQEPDQIKVQSSEQGYSINLKISCASNDMGRLIGRGGKRAQAIRTLMKAKASQLNRRVIVDFID